MSARLPTVVFVHGLRTSQAMWDEQVRALTQLGFPTVAVDLPGHGNRRGDRFTMDRAGDVLDGVVERTGPAGFVLVGLSLGGYTVLNYAASRRWAGLAPGLGLRGVVAAACSSDPSTKPVRAYRDLAAQVVAAGARLRRADVPRQERTQQQGKLPWDVVTDALTSLHRVSPIRDLRRIDVPVLLVNGRWDHLRLEERACLAAARDGRLVVIPRAKHDVSLEAPVRFTRELVGFLTALPEGRTR